MNDQRSNGLLLFLFGYSKPKLWSSEELWGTNRRLGFGPDFLSPQKQAIPPKVHWIGLWCALFGVERWWRGGGCLGIWSSFLESLKLNKHPLKQSDNFNLFLFCLALSRAPPRHCLLKVPMALFPVPFLFLYIPARCVFGPLPSHSWWWAFCFFWRRTSKGKRLICAFPPLCGSCHKKPELSAAGSQQR